MTFGPDTLPYGVDADGHVVVAIGEEVLDLSRAEGLDVGPDVWSSGSLNAFMALGPSAWSLTRRQLREGLGSQPSRARRHVHEVSLVLPIEVGDYADFYASRQHVTNMGALLRPDEDPLPPAWLHLPIGYHGRAGTLLVSGSPIFRPSGITSEGFGASKRLDVEVELGFVVGQSCPRGSSVPASASEAHVFGVVLVNDWSARDIQAFEYRPLGPFLGKSFATSVSPWVVPLAALAPRRVRGPLQDPAPAGYLEAPEPRGFDIELTLTVNGIVRSRTNARHMYWSMSQQLAHLTVNGAGVRVGDLFASGTISGPHPGSEGSLMEIGRGELWLDDGDVVTITGQAGPVCLGEVTGVIQ